MTDNTELDVFRKRVSNPALRNFERRVRRLYASVANKLAVANARGESQIRLSVDCYPRFISRFAASQVWDELNHRAEKDGLQWRTDATGNRDVLVFERKPQ